MKVVLTESRHAAILSRYYRRNEARFQPWNPGVEPEYHTVAAWEQRLRQREHDFRLGVSAHFIGVDAREREVRGACSLTNIIRGPFQACHMGYSVDGRYEGKGVMAEIVQTVIDYAFKELGLNRVMANYMPANKRSAALLEKLGFEKEGYARRYLRINGQWEDHILTSLLNPHPPEA